MVEVQKSPSKKMLNFWNRMFCSMNLHSVTYYQNMGTSCLSPHQGVCEDCGKVITFYDR